MEHMDIISALIEIAQRKEDHLQEMLKLTTTQRIFIKNGDMERLSEAIDHKQLVMEQIHELDLAFLEHYNQLKKKFQIQSFEEMDVNKYPNLKDLKLNIQKILQLLRQIDGLDNENKQSLKADLEKVKDEMKKVKKQQQSAKIVSSYQNKYVGGQGVFIDNKENK